MTPDQVNYEAFEAALPERLYFPAPSWTTVSVAHQRAWEAAAQAAIAAWWQAHEAIICGEEADEGEEAPGG